MQTSTMRNEKKAQYLHSHFLVVNVLAEEFHCVHSAVVNTAHCLTKKLETLCGDFRNAFEIRKVRTTINCNWHRLFARVIFVQFNFLHRKEVGKKSRSKWKCKRAVKSKARRKLVGSAWRVRSLYKHNYTRGPLYPRRGCQTSKPLSYQTYL